MLNENFVYVGLFIASLGNIVYLIQTLRGKVQPNRVTWFLWALAPLIAFAAQIKQGVGVQSLLTFSIGFFPLIIFLASFVNKKAFWKITKLDMFFGSFSVIGLILWFLTGIGNLAILFSLIADGMASLPTIIKSYNHPESENAFAYGTTATGAILTILTIRNWNFATYSFPFLILFTNSLLAVLIYSKIGKGLNRGNKLL